MNRDAQYVTAEPRYDPNVPAITTPIGFSFPWPPKCSWRNDDLARTRKDRALHRHQHDDAEITAAEDPIKPRFKKMMHIVIPIPSTTLRASSVEQSLDIDSE
jgi:hypothetical protein